MANTQKQTTLYERFRSVSKEKWEKASADEVAVFLGFTKTAKDEKKPAAQVAGAARILARVAHQYDEKTFLDAVDKGEVPPLKLSSEEMQLISGGGLWQWIKDQFNAGRDAQRDHNNETARGHVNGCSAD